jgi:hypothetical protein
VKCCATPFAAVYCVWQKFFTIHPRREARRMESDSSVPPPPRAPNAAFCSGGRMEWPWGRPASEVRQPSSVPVYARLSPSRSSRPCQEPSFRSLIISASLPPCICNDLFTSLCQLPLPDRALPKDKGHVVFSFACLLLPHTAWHRLGPGNCMRTSG